MSSVIYYTEILANLFLRYFLKVYGNRKGKKNFDCKLQQINVCQGNMFHGSFIKYVRKIFRKTNILTP